MRALLVAAACLAATAAAHAQVQVSLGPLVGANLATCASSESGLGAYGYRFGGLAGARAEVSWGRFSVQPTLAFSQLGSTLTYTLLTVGPGDPALPSGEIKYATRLNYLVLPVPIAFSLNGTKTGPQVVAGPYVGVLLGGRVESSTSSGRQYQSDLYVADQVDFSSSPGPCARRLDAGLQAGLGFRLQSVLLQASYSLGLRSFEPSYTYRGASIASADNYNRSFQASASYLFALKH